MITSRTIREIIFWLLAVVASSAAAVLFAIQVSGKYTWAVLPIQILLFSVGAYGGVKGFVKYVVRGESGPIAKFRIGQKIRLRSEAEDPAAGGGEAARESGVDH